MERAVVAGDINRKQERSREPRACFGVLLQQTWQHHSKDVVKAKQRFVAWVNAGGGNLKKQAQSWLSE